jgi:hypothetical protein
MELRLKNTKLEVARKPRLDQSWESDILASSSREERNLIKIQRENRSDLRSEKVKLLKVCKFRNYSNYRMGYWFGGNPAWRRAKDCYSRRYGIWIKEDPRYPNE